MFTVTVSEVLLVTAPLVGVKAGIVTVPDEVTVIAPLIEALIAVSLVAVTAPTTAGAATTPLSTSAPVAT